ncbi:MAG: DUF3187 domain-containing protein [Epsilonproteobacteria bacterium]|nr:DUF3187 domain-containing protein [Campylobacterota bacterium]
MYKILTALLIISYTFLLANDFDMDGVEDVKDSCPNTPMSDLVDINGCTIKSLVSPHHFDIIFGLNYTQTDYESLGNSDTFDGSLQVDYYYKDFSIQASTSYYSSSSDLYSDSGIADSFIGAYYKIYPLNDLSVLFGGGLILPTNDSSIDNNNVDYTASLNLSYMLEKVNIFGGYSYTIINDDDTIDVKYQDTNSYSLGVGFYPTQELYLSGSFNSSSSIYKNVDDINTLSVYAFYTINTNWFTNFSYAYGLSDSASDNYLSLKLGYYF